MGRQVRFRATDADLRMLEEHLRDIGAVFVPWMASSPEVVTQPTMDPPRGWATDPWIVRREDLPCLTRYLVEAQGYWLIDDEACPVIDWDRDRSHPEPGRIHFSTQLRVDGEWVPAPKEFMKWADGILQWVRRRWVYDPEAMAYYGPQAAKAAGLRSTAKTSQPRS